MPDGSVSVTLTTYEPSVIGVLGVQVQLPPTSTVAVHSTGPPEPSLTVTVSPGTPVPPNIGVVSVVGAFAVGEITLGTVGATVSTSNARVVGVLTLPAGSVTATLTVCGTSVKGVLGVQVQLPLASATAMQIGTPPSVTFTVLPGSAVPVRVGVLSFVFAPTIGAVTTGALGAVLSTP